MAKQFKVRNKVRIVRIVDSFDESGMENCDLLRTLWNNSWEPDMDLYVNDGDVYTIVDIDQTGVYFEETGRFGWPAKALQHVNAKQRRVM